MRARLFLLMLLLSGCGEEVPKPAAAPLAASDVELSQLYKWGRGPWDMASATDLQIARPPGEEPLLFNVYYPLTGAPDALPVLLFSHGNFSTNSRYDNLIEHWVSHGYVVMAPLHMDGSGGYVSGTINMIRYGNLHLIQARVDDMLVLLDAFPEIEAMVPALQGRLDESRIAATGHSFGAFTAQQLGGARAFDADNDSWVDVRDERLKAVVAISPPGPMFDEIAEGSWDGQDVPTLMTTGTWDSNTMFTPDWRSHKLSFETARPGDQYALVVQGADHYLGNLICRPELEEPPQHDALAMVNTTVIAFLDAYVKNDQDARAFLQSSSLSQLTGEFATLEQR